MLLNSDEVLELSRYLAGRVLTASTNRVDLNELATQGYRQAFGRDPRPDERERAVAFLRRQPDLLSGCDDALTMPIPMPEGPTPVQGAALVDFCHALLNSERICLRGLRLHPHWVLVGTSRPMARGEHDPA